MKYIYKAATLCLATVMGASLIGCSKQAQSSLQDTSSSESQVISQAQSASSSTSEQTSSSQAQQDTSDAMDFPWVKTHESADFSIEDLYHANSASVLAPAGSGKALKVDVKQYEVTISEDASSPTVESEPSYEAVFYSWFDEEGDLNWLRMGEPYVTNSYNHDDLDGDYGYSIVWQEDTGAIMYKIYPQISYQKAVCDTFYPLYDLGMLMSPLVSDPSSITNEMYDPYKEFMAQGTYEMALGDDQGNMYTAHLDDNMIVKILLQDSGYGVQMAAIPSVIDISEVPQLPDFSDQMVECTIIENGKEYTVPMMKGVENRIDASADQSTVPGDISISTDVEINVDGNAVTSLENNAAFILEGPVTFTVDYTSDAQ